jgi:transposase
VWVPDEDSEALRDLVRQREAAKQDQLRARHRLTKFLLRTDRRPPLGLKPWTERYLRWLAQIRYTQLAQEVTLRDCMNEVEHMGARVKRLEEAILEVVKLAPQPMQEVIRGLQALRVQSRAQPLRDAEARVILWYGLLLDIDDRKKAEEV